MDYLIIAAISLVVIAALFFIFKRGFHTKNQKVKSPTNRMDNAEIVVPHRKFNRVRVTLEESWKFLTDISNSVINKFSKRDQALVLELGRVMHKAGAVYNHVIEYGVRTMYQFTPNESQSQTENKVATEEKGKKTKAQR